MQRPLHFSHRLALASLGWDVLATDVPTVINSVLAENITNNQPSLPIDGGSVEARVLDWTVPPENWTWHHASCIADASVIRTSAVTSELPPILAPPFQLIVSADTIYSDSLIAPFLRTLHTMSTLSIHPSSSNRAPPIYICLERRDPALVDRTFSEAKEVWNFSVERIPHKKVVKAMKNGGIKWDRSEWEGVEIWKLVLQTT